MGVPYQARHWVRLTAACNNRCTFCLDAAARMGEILKYDAIMDDLRRGYEAGMRRVVLSGGEPTIHPDYVKIIGRAREMGYTHIQTVSNGRMFCYSDFLDAAIKAGLRETTFSVHGHTAQLHDMLVGTPGAWKQTVTGLVRALNRPELIVSCDIVLNRQNIVVVEDLLWFYLRLGVREFDLLHVIPFSAAWENWDLLAYDPDKTLKQFHRALRMALNMGATMWTNRMPARYLEGFEDQIQSPKKLHDEVRGRNKMFTEFVTSGKMMHCRGERCSFCFMQNWCGDLIECREKGEIRGHAGPACQTPPGAPESEAPVFKFAGAATDLKEWTQFFIDHRYFVKGSACKDCAVTNACAGESVGRVKEEGFGILKALARAPRKKRPSKKSVPAEVPA